MSPLSSSWAHQKPTAFLAETKGLPEAHRTSKVLGPRGHCTPLPSPLGSPVQTRRPAIESSRTTLASRTHFKVLGLEAYKSSKMPCPWPTITLFFDLLKMGQRHDLFFLHLKFDGKFAIFCARICFFREHLRVVSLVFDLERVCSRRVGPWSWPQIFLCPWPLALCPRLSTTLPIFSEWHFLVFRSLS